MSKRDDGKGNIIWSKDYFEMPKHGTQEYWDKFYQNLKDINCLKPPSTQQDKLIERLNND